MAIFSLSFITMSTVLALLTSYYWSNLVNWGYFSLCLPLFAFLYLCYYLKYRLFSYSYFPKHPGAIYRGRTPPAFPNGWYVICKAVDLKVGDVKALCMSGQEMVLFRGEDGTAYALDAFCPHSGANMGVGGQVKHMSCVQCPFHGWLFDGKTGSLVAGSNLIPRNVQFFEYTQDFTNCNLTAEEVLRKAGEGPVTIRKYLLKEISGFLHIWLHSDPLAVPAYEPLDFSDFVEGLDFRGTSINKVYAHAQDIVENGGDIRHFLYVHSFLLPFTRLLTLEWDPKWLRGDDPDLRAQMKHPVPWVTKFKYDLLDLFITKENASSIGVMNLTLNICVPFFKPLFFFNATIFQVGPGLVYLFLTSPYYRALYFQHTTSIGKFEHDVHHQLYTSWHLPYWSTASMLRLEAEQVTNDTYVWNKKKFASEPKYNIAAEADATLLAWRRWFTQFYRGCTEREGEREKYVW